MGRAMSIASVLAALRKEYAPTLLADVHQLTVALDQGDLPAARRIAHRLMGTAGSFGFKEASTAAGAVEDAIDANDPAALQIALAELKNRAEIGKPDIE
jgi:HPt (histidine-containing phosphotransfer) domain-containing protein